MKKISLTTRLALTSVSLVTVGIFSLPATVTLAVNKTAASTSNQTTTQQQHLATIKQKGTAEINRRLTQLGKLNSVISSATHLTASDKSYLEAEVNTEVSGLTDLETTLNGETALAAAITDAKSIYTEYRVFALVTPKVWLVKTADDQQSVEAKLGTLEGKLQTRINIDQTAGKSVTTLQTSLSDMNTQITNSQTISSAVETAVLPLQPADYNTDTSVLSGYNTKLKTAHGDNVTAYNDAKTIVTGLKSL
jgi:hypothetical protein